VQGSTVFNSRLNLHSTHVHSGSMLFYLCMLAHAHANHVRISSVVCVAPLVLATSRVLSEPDIPGCASHPGACTAEKALYRACGHRLMWQSRQECWEHLPEGVILRDASNTLLLCCVHRRHFVCLGPPPARVWSSHIVCCRYLDCHRAGAMVSLLVIKGKNCISCQV
jgi:hypothetical protein